MDPEPTPLGLWQPGRAGSVVPQPHRDRERFREVKHGAGLNHLPSADPGVNSVWIWAGLLAGALSVMLQSLTGLDTQAHAPGRMRIATLRHQLLNLPGRLIRHARGQTLRLRPGDMTLPAALARLRALPAPT